MHTDTVYDVPTLALRHEKQEKKKRSDERKGKKRESAKTQEGKHHTVKKAVHPYPSDEEKQIMIKKILFAVPFTQRGRLQAHRVHLPERE